MAFCLVSLWGCSKNPTALQEPQAASIATFTDIDGNVYHGITLGTQVWSVEGLKTTRLNDGTAIPLVADSAAWINLKTPGYCWYKDSVSYGYAYGALYNWYAVNTGKLAPAGWHVPTETEWNIVRLYLGRGSVTAGPINPVYPNNVSIACFPPLLGGHRDTSGIFSLVRYYGSWWSSTASDTTHSWSHDMYFGNTNVSGHSSGNNAGLSIRCVRDN